jgi:hypothetical protein
MAIKLVLGLLALFSVTLSSANEFAGGDVVHLTSSNYDDLVSPRQLLLAQ